MEYNGVTLSFNNGCGRYFVFVGVHTIKKNMLYAKMTIEFEPFQSVYGNLNE